MYAPWILTMHIILLIPLAFASLLQEDNLVKLNNKSKIFIMCQGYNHEYHRTVHNINITAVHMYLHERFPPQLYSVV